MKEKFDVNGMSCAACQIHIEKNIEKLEGVTDVNVSLLQNMMTVEYDKDKTNSDIIIKAVENGGYSANIQGKNNTVVVDKLEEHKRLKYHLIVSTIILIVLSYVAMGKMLGLPYPSILSGAENSLFKVLIEFILAIPILILNKKYFVNGFIGAIHKSPNMDSLVALGSGASIVYSVFNALAMAYYMGRGSVDIAVTYSNKMYIESGAMILVFVSIGKFLESRSKNKTGEALDNLNTLVPDNVVVIKNNENITVPFDSLQQNDIVLVKSGDFIPADGKIIEGMASIDESTITGESTPIDKSINDAVISGTVVTSGYLKFIALNVGEETTLSNIINLVDEARISKAPISRLANKIASVFVPIVIGISLVTFVIWIAVGADVSFALNNAISILVISCPCALGLATPTAITVGFGKAANMGILIKDAKTLEVLNKIDTVVLDKTGTITKGKPIVNNKVLNYENQEQLMAYIYSLESLNEHPLAKAILNDAKSAKNNDFKVNNYNYLQSLGVSGEIDGNVLYIGNINLLKQLKIENSFETFTNKANTNGSTVLYIILNNVLVGAFDFIDEIKEDSLAAIKLLKARNLKIAMITGDNKAVANSIKTKLNLDEVYAEVLPEDKAKYVAKLQADGHNVLMVGDGVNDSIALATANIGIAIGSGTDVAINSSDVVLMKNSLVDIVNAYDLSKKTILNIKENLFWALIYNVIGIPLAAGLFYSSYGLQLNPMFGSAAMAVSSLIVISNALRLKLFKPIEIVVEAKEKDIKIIKEKTLMEKTINIDGMMCEHCVNHVAKALNSLDGVTAIVNLEKNNAIVKIEGNINDKTLTDAIIEAGYTVTSIK